MADTARNSAAVAEFQSNLINGYTMGMAITLAAFEYILLFQYEINFLRERRRSPVTWLFLASRYLMLAQCIIMVAPSNLQVRMFNPSHPSNASIKSSLTVEVIGLLPSVIAAVFSALRTVALIHHRMLKYLIAVFVFILGLAPVITNGYYFSRLSLFIYDDPVFGPTCFATYSISAAANFHRPLDSSITYYRGHHCHSRNMVEDIQTSSSDSFCRHITKHKYNAPARWQCILHLLVDTVPEFQDANPVSNITTVMQPILISRFLANLRQVHENPTGSTTGQASTTSSMPQFRSVNSEGFASSAPMGEPLEYGDDIGSEDGDCPTWPSGDI
ncbi:hypothetical protein NM688_g4977 [Phlebia brevispora]|uniref:Uncharacterized protein n=1 Tax=Phlebia brevispora TaxID=194682 RepID=A0ACC1T1K1_9APHY|nr:hypothetical protein NM688_g4977 [Phlebia brevispora]